MSSIAIQQPQQSSGYSTTAELTVELAKMLALVAPSSMTAEQQEIWLRAALDSLEGIRASEVRDVSLEVRRSATRHNQIVPEISKLVAEKRARRASINEATPPANALSPPHKRDVMDRRGQAMTEEEAAELNERLERLGAKARYRPDGSRYFVEVA
jgi:hypothetical protein